MSDYEFTEEERRLIALYTHKPRANSDRVFLYGSYILPSFLFACYALWKHDFLAALTAYIALFIMALLYVGKSVEYTATIVSICKKAEALSAALKQGRANEI